jgi:hypothetical protein
MPAESISHLVTAEGLPGISIPGKSFELVRGVLVVREPPSTRHGRVAAWAAVYRENGDVTIVGPDDRLDGEDVLPGFHCALAEVFR